MTACAGDTITIPGVAYLTDTTLTLPALPNTSGGTFAGLENLIFFPIPAFSDSLQLCAGDTVTIGGVKYFKTARSSSKFRPPADALP